MKHDEVVFRVGLGSAGHGEFVDNAVSAGERDHVGGAFAGSVRVRLWRGCRSGGVAVRGGECGERTFEGEECKDGGFGSSG